MVGGRWQVLGAGKPFAYLWANPSKPFAALKRAATCGLIRAFSRWRWADEGTGGPLTAQRKQGAQASIAQVQAAPEERSENDREEDIEHRIADAHVGIDGPAEIARQ